MPVHYPSSISPSPSPGAEIEVIIQALDLKWIETLYRGKTRVLFRASKEGSREAFLVKALSLEEASLSQRLLLRRSFDFIQNESPPNAGEVLAYLSVPETDAILFRDFPGVLLSTLSLPQELSIASVLNLTLHIAEALASLHNAGFILHGINAWSIVYDSDCGNVYFLDFEHTTLGEPFQKSIHIPLLATEGLPYLSPERTGRISLPVDARSDQYALGVLLYSMLVGFLPFEERDPGQLIFAHITLYPTNPREIDERVPLIFSQINMKLLAKNPRERYCSVTSLLQDLLRLKHSTDAQREVESFPLGFAKNIPYLFSPNVLFGREEEQRWLCEVLEKVSKGGRHLLLIEGDSGVGKSSLVETLKSKVRRQNGIFLKGKSSLLRPPVPYAGIIQVMDSFCDLILTIESRSFNRWRTELRVAMGTKGEVLPEVFPRLGALLNLKAIAPPRQRRDGKQRLLRAIQLLLESVANIRTPFVIFMDDLQWVDAATWSLLQSALRNPKIEHLLVIGAFRTREDRRDQLFSSSALLNNEEHGATLHQLKLRPLKTQDLSQMIARSLGRTAEEVKSLSAQIFEKTKGNPLFTMESLRALCVSKEIWFDLDRGQWFWKLDPSGDLFPSKDVLALVTERIGKLPLLTQDILSLGACFGESFNSTILSHLYGCKEEGILKDLQPAEDAGLVFKVGSPPSSVEGEKGRRFCFAHDRVQQASYARIGEKTKTHLHADIAEVFLREENPSMLVSMAPIIISQFRRSPARALSSGRRKKLIELSLLTGQRELSGAAYQAASINLFFGASLTLKSDWKDAHSVIFTLHLKLAEALLLSDSSVESDSITQLLLTHSEGPLERAEIIAFRAYHSAVGGHFHAAFLLFQEALGELGVLLPKEEDLEGSLQREMVHVEQLIQGHKQLELETYQIMESPQRRLQVRLLEGLGSPPILGRTSLLRAFAVTKAMGFIIEEGITPQAPNLGALYGQLTPRNNDKTCKRAYKLSKASITLARSLDDPANLANTLLNFGCGVHALFHPMSESLSLFEEAFSLAAQVRPSGPSAFAIEASVMMEFLKGDDLPSILKRLDERNRLLGTNAGDKVFLSGSTFVNKIREIVSGQRPHHQNPSSRSLANCPPSLLIKALEGKHEKILKHFKFKGGGFLANIGRDLLGDLLEGLSLIVLCPVGNTPPKRFRVIEENIARRSRRCPENFEHQMLLLRAERARIEGALESASADYEDALQGAQIQGFTHIAALIATRAACFWRTRNIPRLAIPYEQQAAILLRHWDGGNGFFQAFKNFPEYQHPSESGNPNREHSLDQRIDRKSFLEAAQALADEVGLDALLFRVVQVIMESAGADQAHVLMAKNAVWTPQVTGVLDRKGGILSPPSISISSPKQAHPSSIINFVARTGKSLRLLAPISRDERFSLDPYLIECRAEAILCIPLNSRGQLVGLLYLENHVLSEAFTPSRIQYLEALSGLIASAINQAELLSRVKSHSKRLEEQAIERTQKLNERNEALYLLTAAVENSPAMTLIYDLSGIIVYANKRVEDMMGYRCGELIGESLEILLSKPFVLEEAAEILAKVLSGEIWSGETSFKRKDQSIFWASRKLVAVSATGGEMTHIVSVKEDITEKRRARELLKAAKESAEAASDAKSTFLANMSHEIRTPLSTIIGIAQLAELSAPDPLQRGYFQKIQLSSQNLLQIINEILDFSKLEAKKTSLYIDQFSFSDLISRIQDQASILIYERPIEVLWNIDKEISNQLLGDELRLGQILTNLVSNAIKFTELGKVEIHFQKQEISKESEDFFLICNISDTGIGLSQEDIQKIFQPFVQADSSATRRYGGSGLGLMITKHLVELMGGELSVQSVIGRGSVFTFSVKIRAQTQNTIEGKFIKVPSIMKDLRVLILSKSEATRANFSQILCRMDLSPTEASSSSEALVLSNLASKQGDPFTFWLIDEEALDWDDAKGEFRLFSSLKAEFPCILVGPHRELNRGSRCKVYIDKSFNSQMLLPAIFQAIGFFPAPFPEKKPPSRLNIVSSNRWSESVHSLLQGIRVLLVEDHELNLEVIRATLRHKGMLVEAVSNGLEAVKRLSNDKALPIDVVLMDLQMPVMGGIEATIKIRENHRLSDLPIIALTANMIQDERERCFSVGMNGFVSKPVNIDQLMFAIASAIEEANSAAALKSPLAFLTSLDELEFGDVSDELLTEISEKNAGLKLPWLPDFDTVEALLEFNGNSILFLQEALKFATSSIMSELEDAQVKRDFGLISSALREIKASSNRLSAKILYEVAHFVEEDFLATRELSVDGMEALSAAFQGVRGSREILEAALEASSAG